MAAAPCNARLGVGSHQTTSQHGRCQDGHPAHHDTFPLLAHGSYRCPDTWCVASNSLQQSCSYRPVLVANTGGGRGGASGRARRGAARHRSPRGGAAASVPMRAPPGLRRSRAIGPRRWPTMRRSRSYRRTPTAPERKSRRPVTSSPRGAERRISVLQHAWRASRVTAPHEPAPRCRQADVRGGTSWLVHARAL
jgi:hypothetical protein